MKPLGPGLFFVRVLITDSVSLLVNYFRELVILSLFQFHIMAKYQKKGTFGKRGMLWERNEGVGYSSRSLSHVPVYSLLPLSMALRSLLCTASLSYNFSEDVALWS